MKTRKLVIPLAFFSAISFFAASSDSTLANENTSNPTDAFSVYQSSSRNEASPRIQVALLLDTSNSMDGLIEQAKSRLWNIINTLSTLKYQGKEPVIEISLYEYGNNNISEKKGYIRQVLPLSSDLDLLSEKLFALTTYGGDEYCGQVIHEATNQLDWSNSNADMKLIYIAGNEPFDQGKYPYAEAISKARRENIYINTIYCGNYDAGIRELWKDGAKVGKGKYFNIDSDKKVRFIATPYDDRISDCNKRLNATYIGYGSEGKEKKMNQEVQDQNASKISASNYVERSVSKSKSNQYKNSSWDLVDRAKEEPNFIEKIEKEYLPDHLQGKTDEELKQFVASKEKERKEIQNEMEELATKRQAYIDEELKNSDDQDDLGSAITSSIIELANEVGYKQ